MRIRKISISEFLVDCIPNSLSEHRKKFMADNNEILGVKGLTVKKLKQLFG